MFPVIIFGIHFIVIISFVITIIVRAVKSNRDVSNKERASNTFENTISNANDPDSYGNSLSSQPTETYCKYCGSKVFKLKRKCPSCGASIQNDDQKQ